MVGVGQSVDRLKRPIARPVGLQNKEMFKLNTGRRKNEGLRLSLPLHRFLAEEGAGQLQSQLQSQLTVL